MGDIVQLIKKAAVEAVNASDPVSVVYGMVESVNPLRINVEQKMVLSSEFLILTNAVKDYYVDMTVSHRTDTTVLNANHSHETDINGSITVTSKIEPPEDGKNVVSEVNDTKITTINTVQIDLSHSHSYSGTKRFLVHNGLKIGEKVVMLRIQGGQKFIVLERLVQ